jgi:VWFA-related protein
VFCGCLSFSWLGAALLVAQSLAPGLATVPAALLDTPRRTFRSAIDLVTLNVSVTDGRSRSIGGLSAGDFQVLEDGVPQDVSYFAATSVPLDVALLIDSSSSMREKMSSVQLAAESFVKALRPEDRGMVVEFNDQVRVLQPFVNDRAQLTAAIRHTRARGATALYTAVYVTLDQFSRARSLEGANGEIRRPAIIVLTDGDDTSSLIQFDDLLERARRTGVAIYPISMIAPAESERLQQDGSRRFLGESDYLLKSLAQETGARAFFPTLLSELDSVYQSVADELALQYALGYTSKSGRLDGTFHRLVVRVPTRPELRSRTRMGYYADVPTRAGGR